MNNKRTPWAYRSGSTIIHRLPPGIKLICLVSLSLAAFFPGGIALSTVAALIAAGAIAAKIRPHELLRGSGPLFLVIGFTAVVRGAEFFPPGIDMEGLKKSLLFGLKAAVSFAAGALLFSTTTMTEIKKSISRAEQFFRIKKPYLSLGISLMLGFIPRFFEIWEAAALAWEARGGKNNFRRLVRLFPPVIERMLETAAETAAAMESRSA
ncbi:MAG: energy-coupling factor transporter transmembrane protein EcfT [Treponema sp.]|nr:energy-coupling factor transporter transmembrane protein EcfT [Treponema sp.]